MKILVEDSKLRRRCHDDNCRVRMMMAETRLCREIRERILVVVAEKKSMSMNRIDGLRSVMKNRALRKCSEIVEAIFQLVPCEYFSSTPVIDFFSFSVNSFRLGKFCSRFSEFSPFVRSVMTVRKL